MINFIRRIWPLLFSALFGFLFALFLLQTKFRPELQEDQYYSQYLDKKTNTIVKVSREEAIEKGGRKREEEMRKEEGWGLPAEKMVE